MCEIMNEKEKKKEINEMKRKKEKRKLRPWSLSLLTEPRGFVAATSVGTKDETKERKKINYTCAEAIKSRPLKTIGRPYFCTGVGFL